jgi:hypothetical protein
MLCSQWNVPPGADEIRIRPQLGPEMSTVSLNTTAVPSGAMFSTWTDACRGLNVLGVKPEPLTRIVDHDDPASVTGEAAKAGAATNAASTADPMQTRLIPTRR